MEHYGLCIISSTFYVDIEIRDIKIDPSLHIMLVVYGLSIHIVLRSHAHSRISLVKNAAPHNGILNLFN